MANSKSTPLLLGPVAARADDGWAVPAFLPTLSALLRVTLTLGEVISLGGREPPILFFLPRLPKPPKAALARGNSSLNKNSDCVSFVSSPTAEESELYIRVLYFKFE